MVVRSVWGMLKRVKNLEGWKGWYKGEWDCSGTLGLREAGAGGGGGRAKAREGGKGGRTKAELLSDVGRSPFFSRLYRLSESISRMGEQA